MIRLRIVLCLVLLVGVVPAGVAGALALVEGDRGWECDTMGNGVCGPDGSLVEGDPGWDCETMGNGDCGADAATLSGTPIGPPYVIEAVGEECEPIDDVDMPIRTAACVTEIDPDPQSGAVELSSSIASTNRASSAASVRWAAQHQLPTAVREIQYLVELDLESARAIAAPNSDATVSFNVDVFHDGCVPRCSTQAGGVLVQVGDFEPCQESPCGIDVCLQNPCTALREAERLTFPILLQGRSGGDLPSGTVTIRMQYTVRLSARPIGGNTFGGASLANASLDVSRTTVTVGG